ncbi:hypothetical protein PGN35_021815 [Nodosilinea sp. PGN35]|uniref:hypothetical protein n=1 Tax=Nodosilinea sp. PGN35 TaxID=3020489 RepID=UPI0023B2D498|nr:hypothetical protein [Nodosilinea sp. TSF1-S3]MDF0366997.1 hypothetical protein [Nodosilinea sp. TSF1-S3]
MSVSPRFDASVSLATVPAPAMACKLLFDRDLYTPCHIRVPDVDHRLSAVYVDNQFYSFLKVVPEARKALDVVTRLSKRDHTAALTQTRRGYAVWAYEPQARYAPPASSPGYGIQPVFGPQDCLVVSDETAYQTCRLQVPDVTKPLMALTYNSRYYSFFKQDTDAAKVLDMAAKLARRGDQTLLVVEPPTFTLALLEPNGRLV